MTWLGSCCCISLLPIILEVSSPWLLVPCSLPYMDQKQSRQSVPVPSSYGSLSAFRFKAS